MRLSFVIVLKKQVVLLSGYLMALVVPVSALHFDHDAFNFTTLDEFLSPGKELKIWSDTVVRITGIGFKNRMNGGWQRTTSKGIPCTLSVGDTLAVRIYASYIKSAENPVIDSLIVVVNQSLAGASYVQLHVGAFPHVLVTTDTITGPLTIAPAGINASAGAYKSGFFIFGGTSTSQYIDFSQGVNTPQDSDVVVSYRNGCLCTAPFGVLNLGIFDSLPTIDISGYVGFVPETSSVCRTYKSTFDSIVKSHHFICPAVPADTCVAGDLKQVSMVRTKEGHYAILVKVGEYIGGINRDYYYWGYQSDGNRMFAPGPASGLNNQLHDTKLSGKSGMQIAKHGNTIHLSFPREGTIKTLSVYKCDGSLLFRHAITMAKSNSIEFGRLPKGLYIVSVQTEKQRMNQRLFIF